MLSKSDNFLTNRKESFLLRWQGFSQLSTDNEKKLVFWAGFSMMILLSSLPFLSRYALGIMIFFTGILWTFWSLVSVPSPLGITSRWILIFIGLSFLSTCFSPVDTFHDSRNAG